jgi:hypothetical protein
MNKQLNVRGWEALFTSPGNENFREAAVEGFL